MARVLKDVRVFLKIILEIPVPHVIPVSLRMRCYAMLAKKPKYNS